MARDKEGRDIQFSRTDSSNIAHNCLRSRGCKFIRNAASRGSSFCAKARDLSLVVIKISRDHLLSSRRFRGTISSKSPIPLRLRDIIREGSRIRVVDGRTKRRDGWTDGRMDGRAGEGAYETIRFEQLSATTSLKFSVSAPWWNECLSL